MTAAADPVQEYLDQLRTSLRRASTLRRVDASAILAEAEDHIRSRIADGVAAGQTESTAQEAALASFGSVRSVVRAHRTRRGVATAVLGDLGFAAWKFAGLLLLVTGLAGVLAAIGAAVLGVHDAQVYGSPMVMPGLTGQILGYLRLEWVQAGLAGLVLLVSYRVVRRRLRRARPPLGAYFPLVAACLFACPFLFLWAAGLNLAGNSLIGWCVLTGGTLAAIAMLGVYPVRLVRAVVRHRRTPSLPA
jgi:hypothetical protein